MLWKDFAQEECCDSCPLLENEICPGGFVCYGGQPIEPPCCCFDDNTDLDDWVNDYFEQKKRREELEESRLKKEQKKKGTALEKLLRHAELYDCTAFQKSKR